MAHVRSLSQQLSNAESLNTELDEHTKAIQAAAAARTAGRAVCLPGHPAAATRVHTKRKWLAPQCTRKHELAKQAAPYHRQKNTR